MSVCLGNSFLFFYTACVHAAGRGAQALVHATVLRSLRQLLTGYAEHEDDRSQHGGLGFSNTAGEGQQQQQQRAFALLQVQLYEVGAVLLVSAELFC